MFGLRGLVNIKRLRGTRRCPEAELIRPYAMRNDHGDPVFHCLFPRDDEITMLAPERGRAVTAKPVGEPSAITMEYERLAKEQALQQPMIERVR